MVYTVFAYDKKNLEYLRSYLGEDKVNLFLSVQGSHEPGTQIEVPDNVINDFLAVKQCLSTMNKYDNFHWWESSDAKIAAYYQLMEHTLLIPYIDFCSGLNSLLGRNVWSEITQGKSIKLKDEATQAYMEYMDIKSQE